jgi:hypothetical protein
MFSLIQTIQSNAKLAKILNTVGMCLVSAAVLAGIIIVYYG